MTIPPPNSFLNIDCMELMKICPDNYFDLAMADPPYGINVTSFDIKGNNINKNWDTSPPPKSYFDEVKRISKNQIIWGGNYFTKKILSENACWIFWDKNNGDSTFADGELAWTSFNSSIRKVKIHWCGSAAIHETGINKIHPTQKPVALYKWLLKNYAKPGDKIFDSHVGSGSSLIACKQLGFDYWGTEIDKDYYEAAKKRIAKAFRQYELEL